MKRADELMAKGDFREAIGLYQYVIDKFPDDLWAVSDFGIFAPTVLYCQRRLLELPKKELEYLYCVICPQ